MLRSRYLDCFLDFHQACMGRREVDLLLTHRRADVARDVQVEVVFLDLCHFHPSGVAFDGFLWTLFVGINDLGDMLLAQLILALAFFEVLGGVDEEHIVGLLAFLQHEDAHRDAGGVKKICRQADDSINVAVLEEFLADAFLGTATEQYAVRQDDRHHAFVFEEVEAVQQKGKVSGGLGGEAVAFEAHVVSQRIGRLPAVAKRRVGHDGVEARLFGRVLLAQRVPLVEQGVTVENLKLRILHTVQQHIHAGEVIGGDILLLAEDFADGAACLCHLLAHVEQQGAGAAGHVHHALQPLLRASFRFLAVQRDDGGEDVGNLLRGVELARLLARPGGKLADQVFIGIAQCIDIRRKLRQSFGDLLNDSAELGIPVLILLAQLGGAQVYLGEQALEGAFKRFRLDVFKTRLQRFQQIAVLRAGQVGDAVPQVRGLYDVMHLAPHLFFKFADVLGIAGIPELKSGYDR